MKKKKSKKTLTVNELKKTKGGLRTDETGGSEHSGWETTDLGKETSGKTDSRKDSRS